MFVSCTSFESGVLHCPAFAFANTIEPPFSAFVTTVGGFDVAVGVAHGVAVELANGFAVGVADPDLEVEVVVLSGLLGT